MIPLYCKHYPQQPLVNAVFYYHAWIIMEELFDQHDRFCFPLETQQSG